MRIGLAMKDMPPKQREDGTIRIKSKKLLIIDMNTGEELENKTGFVWCDKSLLLAGDDPILTPEHFEGDPEDASYGVLVFRCDGAINI